VLAAGLSLLGRVDNYIATQQARQRHEQQLREVTVAVERLPPLTEAALAAPGGYSAQGPLAACCAIHDAYQRLRTQAAPDFLESKVADCSVIERCVEAARSAVESHQRNIYVAPWPLPGFCGWPRDCVFLLSGGVGS
jgi:hypothetical protein